MNPDQRLAGEMLLGEVFLIEAWAREIEPEFDRVVERLETRLAKAGLRSEVYPAIAFLGIVGRRVSPCFRASISISDGELDELDESKLRRIAAMAEQLSSSIERGGLRHFDDPGDAVKVVAGLLFACAAEERLNRDGRGMLLALRSAKIIADETQELDGFGRRVEEAEFSTTDSRYVGLSPLLDGVAVLFALSLAEEGGAPLPPRGPRGASASRARRWGWPWSSKAEERKVDPLPCRLAAAVDELRLRELPGDCMARGIGRLDAVLKCAQPPFE